MTFLVPFDDSNLARAALVRAGEYAEALDEDVTVVSVIPEEDAAYARMKGWIDDDDEYSVHDVAEDLHQRVTDYQSSAAFRYERADMGVSSAVADEIKTVADEILPSVVFLGTDNIGEVAQPVTSVAGGVAENAEYDVHIVRHWSPTAVQRIETDATAYPDT